MNDFMKKLLNLSVAEETIEDISIVYTSAATLTKGGGGDNIDDPHSPKPYTYSD